MGFPTWEDFNRKRKSPQFGQQCQKVNVLILLISSLTSSSIIFIHIIIMMKEMEDYLYHLTTPSSSPPSKSANHNIKHDLHFNRFWLCFVQQLIGTTNYSHRQQQIHCTTHDNKLLRSPFTNLEPSATGSGSSSATWKHLQTKLEGLRSCNTFTAVESPLRHRSPGPLELVQIFPPAWTVSGEQWIWWKL